MGDPNTDKAAIVAEVREKFDASDGALLTEYRGLDVPALAALRKELRAAGGEYKIYKNTLVRIAVRSADDIKALAEHPSRDVLLAQIAGLLQAPLAEFVGLLDAVPREFSYALQALIDKGGAGEAGAAAPAEASDDSSDDDAAEEAAEEPAEATAEATEDNVADAGDTEDSAGEADGDNTEEE